MSKITLNVRQKQRLAESLRALNVHIISDFGLRGQTKRLCSGCVSLSEYSSADLVTTDEAAHLLGIGTKTLENWRTAGRGPVYNKIGARVLYAIGDLRKFIKERRRSSTSDSGIAS